WDPGAKQPGVHRARADMHVVDVYAVDADDGGTAVDEPIGCFGGEIGMFAEIGLAAPVTIPAGVNKHCLPFDRAAVEGGSIDGKAILPRSANDEAGVIRERSELEFGEVGAVGVAVKRAVEVGAGVGDHVD